MRVDENQLESFFVDLGLVSRRDWLLAQSAAEEKGENISITLLRKGLVGEDDLRRAQAHALGIPFVSLKERKLDFHTLSFIPEPVARLHNVVAISFSNDSLEVALLDLSDLEAIGFIKHEREVKIIPRFTDSESIKHALILYQKFLKQEFGEAIREALLGLDVEEGNFLKLAESQSASRLLDAIINHALLSQASDVHLEVAESGLLIRYRIFGALREAMVLPKNIVPALFARAKYLSHLNLTESNMPQEGKFEIISEMERIWVRVVTIPVYGGEKIVMKVLRFAEHGPFLELLGLELDALEAVHDALKLRSGLVVVSGPEGERRENIFRGLIDALNTPNLNIVSIEEPGACRMRGITQVEMRPENGFGLPEALRAAVRQDADAIALGELAEREDMRLAVSSASSGKLILIMLTARTGAEAISTLVGSGIDLRYLASGLKLVLAHKPEGGLGITYEAIKITPAMKDLILSGASTREFEKEAQNQL